MKKNIKKGYIITGLGIFILLIAGVLSINKPSLATSGTQSNYCVTQINSVTFEKESISLIKSETNKI